METNVGWELIGWAITLFMMARWMYDYTGGERATLANVMCLVWAISAAACLLFGIFEFIEG